MQGGARARRGACKAGRVQGGARARRGACKAGRGAHITRSRGDGVGVVKLQSAARGGQTTISSAGVVKLQSAARGWRRRRRRWRRQRNRPRASRNRALAHMYPMPSPQSYELYEVSRALRELCENSAKSRRPGCVQPTENSLTWPRGCLKGLKGLKGLQRVGRRVGRRVGSQPLLYPYL